MNLNGPKTFSYYGLNVEVVDEANCLAKIDSAVDCTEFEFTQKMFKPGDRVLVAGGGMGSVAAWTSIKVGHPNVLVYEANPHLVSNFVRNVRFSGEVPNITWGALTTKSGEVDFYIRDHWGGSSLGEGNHADKVTVPAFDINEVITKYALNAISLDVEGAEFDLIPHLNMTPIRAIMMEVHENLERAQELVTSVMNQGFRMTQWHTQHPNHPLNVVGLERTGE